MKPRYSKNVQEAIDILRANGITLQELANGKWQTIEKLPMSGTAERQTWRGWTSACDHFARYCDSDRLYKICAGV